MVITIPENDLTYISDILNIQKSVLYDIHVCLCLLMIKFESDIDTIIYQVKNINQREDFHNVIMSIYYITVCTNELRTYS